MEKKAILLLQMGGPANLDEVEGFLYNLFKDKYIIQLPELLAPYQDQLAKFISSRRAPKVQKNYQKIGGGSPILFETRAQAKALEKRLEAKYKVFIAMRYSSPFMEETMQEILEAEIEELTVIPLYPQYSLATSGSSILEAMEFFDKTGFSSKAKINYIESWHDNQFFIELISRRIEDTITELDRAHILFSAHGLPQSYVENGDPYQKQVEDSVQLVVQRLADNLNLRIYQNKLKSELHEFPWSISYQSRVGPVQWLKPYTDDAIKTIGQSGEKNLVVVPISFVGDHIETLEEIGMEYKNLAHENAIVDFTVTRLPKANPLLIEALASLIPNESTSLQSRKSGDKLSISN